MEAKEKEISLFGKDNKEKDVNIQKFQQNIEKLQTELANTTTAKEELNVSVERLTKERDLLLSEKGSLGQKSAEAVSYTHLTLPTILLV